MQFKNSKKSDDTVQTEPTNKQLTLSGPNAMSKKKEKRD